MATPAETAALWAARFGASSDKYTKAINAVTESPMAKAVAAQDRLVANFNAAVQSGKWAARTGAVQIQTWKTSCVEKGAPALAAAARVGQAKYLAAETRIAPIRASIQASLPPRGTIDQNLERARQMALGMHQAAMRG